MAASRRPGPTQAAQRPTTAPVPARWRPRLLRCPRGGAGPSGRAGGPTNARGATRHGADRDPVRAGTAHPLPGSRSAAGRAAQPGLVPLPAPPGGGPVRLPQRVPAAAGCAARPRAAGRGVAGPRLRRACHVLVPRRLRTGERRLCASRAGGGSGRRTSGHAPRHVQRVAPRRGRCGPRLRDRRRSARQHPGRLGCPFDRRRARGPTRPAVAGLPAAGPVRAASGPHGPGDTGAHRDHAPGT